MTELDKGLVTSAITFICLVIFGFITGDTVGKSEVVGFAVALSGLLVWYYNEKHSSDIISNSDSESIMEDETDLINPEYEEFNDEE